VRWWAVPLVATLSWFAYTLTPFWALYDLSRAVQGGDVAYVERHVNFRTLRLSLARQLSAAIRAQETEGDAPERRRLFDAASALALPLTEALVTPQTVVDLLDDGWPQRIDLPDPPPRKAPEDGLHAPDLRRLAAFYATSEMRGFRAFVMGVPPNRPRAQQFRIRMRLRGFTWRLIDIELSEALREKIAARLARASKRDTDRPVSDEARPDR